MEKPRHPSSFETHRKTIIEDHRQLGDLLTRLQQVPHPSGVTELLDNLRALLRRHFAREQEPDGLFDIIATRAPKHREVVEELMGEHEGFLTELDTLTAAESRPESGSLSDMVIQFVTRLREHESRESKLLVESLSTQRGL